MTICIPPDTDWSCKWSADELAEKLAIPAEAALIERAEAFAWSLLASLTAYQIGTCPITVRPCAARCAPAGSYMVAPVGGGGQLPIPVIGRMSPFISGGVWYNSCGCARPNDCSCTVLSEVILPGPVGRMVSVVLDGVELDRTAYRIDNGNRLVRTDGEPWPSCQDMVANDGEGTFLVTYYRGAAPNAMTRAAAGALASEFYASCTGGACRLPWNVTQASRQGESYDFGEGGLEGVADTIPEVAAVVRIYNPYGLKSRPRVMSPDAPKARVTTWQS